MERSRSGSIRLRNHTGTVCVRVSHQSEPCKYQSRSAYADAVTGVFRSTTADSAAASEGPLSATVGGATALDDVSLCAGGVARLGLRKRPANLPAVDFRPSVSMPSTSDVPSTFFSFLPPRALKNEDRRLSVAGVVGEASGDVVATGEDSEAFATVVGAGATVADSADVVLIGASIRGAVADTGVVSGSLVPTAGEVSFGLMAPLSFLLHRLPNSEFRLTGFGIASAVDVMTAGSLANGRGVS